MYTLNICHLYPDLFNLFGDRGNIIALKNRAQWRGINVNVLNISLGDDFSPPDYDIVFLGGGQGFGQAVVLEDLLKCKRAAIESAVEGGTVFLCVCGGYQMLGKCFKAIDEKEIECLGVLDLWTEDSSERLTGNIVFECDFLKSGTQNGTVIGFENHSGKTYLGTGVQPLGRVIRGYGNNGKDGFEGAVYKNVYCSYAHGSLLPKNPLLADHLLTLALKKKYDSFTALQPLSDEFEDLAHNRMLQRLTGR